MSTLRSYGDACTIARALDVVGERWALLVVRELLLGPRRFADLRRGLPGASSNLVADRVRELAGRGVIHRRKLPPPAASHVYELTGWGRRLEPIVLALGEWGGRIPLPADPPAPLALSVTSVLLYLRGAARPHPGEPPSTCRLQLDEEVWTVRSDAGRVTIAAGEPPVPAGPAEPLEPAEPAEPLEPAEPAEPLEPLEPLVSLWTDPHTFNDLLAAGSTVDDAVAAGRATVEGDRAALGRLLGSVRPLA